MVASSEIATTSILLGLLSAMQPAKKRSAKKRKENRTHFINDSYFKRLKNEKLTTFLYHFSDAASTNRVGSLYFERPRRARFCIAEIGKMRDFADLKALISLLGH